MSMPEPRHYLLDDLEYYPEMFRLVVGKEAVRLNCKEALLLEVFLKRPMVVHSPGFLWDSAWPSSESESWRHTLDSRISSLRGKLGKKWGKRLVCRKKLGFAFCPDGETLFEE